MEHFFFSVRGAREEAGTVGDNEVEAIAAVKWSRTDVQYKHIDYIDCYIKTFQRDAPTEKRVAEVAKYAKCKPRGAGGGEQAPPHETGAVAAASGYVCMIIYMPRYLHVDAPTGNWGRRPEK